MGNERNTKQKKVIYDALCELGHPSATELYEHIRVSHPTISRGTVFRVLNGLTENGRAKKVHFQEGDSLFDATLTPHAHAQCRACGGVFDVELNGLFPVGEKEGKSGFFVEGYSVEINGLCVNCMKEEITQANCEKGD